MIVASQQEILKASRVPQAASTMETLISWVGNLRRLDQAESLCMSEGIGSGCSGRLYVELLEYPS